MRSRGQDSCVGTLGYEGRHGPGRVAIRHDQVVVMDGAPKDRLETLWRWVLATRFLRDERDTWAR